jgi:stringent starvation protein B
MTPIKPFLIHAVRDWAVENGLTPHVMVDAAFPGVKVPNDFVEQGRILLNIHPRAVHAYAVEDGRLTFSARFRGRSQVVEIPVAAVRAVYARENGQGVAFPEESADAGSASAPTEPGPPPKKGPRLKIVK